MGWRLMRGSTPLARLELQGTDMPWFLWSFHAEPAYADVEPLCTGQERLLEVRIGMLQNASRETCIHR